MKTSPESDRIAELEREIADLKSLVAHTTASADRERSLGEQARLLREAEASRLAREKALADTRRFIDADGLRTLTAPDDVAIDLGDEMHPVPFRLRGTNITSSDAPAREGRRAMPKAIRYRASDLDAWIRSPGGHKLAALITDGTIIVTEHTTDEIMSGAESQFLIRSWWHSKPPGSDADNRRQETYAGQKKVR